MSSYIEPPLSTDPEDVAQIAFEYIQAQLPGWVPNAGNLDTILIEAAALIGAETRDVAARVPTTIFRFLGGTLFGLPPIDATYAESTVTFTAIDNIGYAIPAGTFVGIRNLAGEIIPFETLNDLVIPAGATTGSVDIRAVEPGERGSALGGTGVPIDMITALAFISEVEVDAITTGGINGESDADYLNRLVNRLQLIAPRPILPEDFASFTRDIAGVKRVRVLDLYVPGINEMQRITITGGPTGGTFTLTWNGQGPTSGIAYNATAEAVRLALEALSNIAPGDILVTGGPLPASPIFVEFVGAKGNSDQPAMTASSVGLTGGSSPTAVIDTFRAGAGPTSNQERNLTVVAVDETGEQMSSVKKAEIDAYLQSLREASFIVHVDNPTYHIINVAADVVKKAGYDAAEVEAAIEDALENFLSPAVYGRDPLAADLNQDETWVASSTIRRMDLVPVIDNIAGVDYIVNNALWLAVAPTDPRATVAALDITMSGAAPLPRPGTMDINVT